MIKSFVNVGILCILWHIILLGLAFGLEPESILIVANTRMAGSADIARYYQQKRSIPEGNYLGISMSFTDEMSRDEFDIIKRKILDKISKLVLKQGSKEIEALVLCYGVPLRVSPSPTSKSEQEHVRYLQKKMESSRVQGEGAEDLNRKSIKEIQLRINQLQHKSELASVDSELALINFGKYSLQDWIPNPLFSTQSTIVTDNRLEGLADKQQSHGGGTPVLLVARLDGPDTQTVYRLIDDSLSVEKDGLQGIAYFDARWPEQKSGTAVSAYQHYDNSIHAAARLVSSQMNVVVDDQPQLFGAGACPQAALYCGWYSLGRYIDSFSWQKGAVGYHIASSECVHLRKAGNTQWCANMLSRGVAAVIGPVAEPYVQGFPLPEVFFRELVVNKKSVGESYMAALPYLSWRMVLVGDPLYTPFLHCERK